MQTDIKLIIIIIAALFFNTLLTWLISGWIIKKITYSIIEATMQGREKSIQLLQSSEDQLPSLITTDQQKKPQPEPGLEWMNRVADYFRGIFSNMSAAGTEHYRNAKRMLCPFKRKLTRNTTLLAKPWMVLAALAVGVVAQICIHFGYISIGTGGYLLSGVLMVSYLLKNPCAFELFIRPLQVSRRLEVIFIGLIILIAFGTRLYKVADYPYGYEADAMRIAAQSFYDYDTDLPGEMSAHSYFLPVTFFLQHVAFLIFGPGMTTARILAAGLGGISVVLMYFIMKRISSSLPAFFASFFYAVSYIALSACRQASIEASVEVWVLLTYLCALEAVFSKEVKYYLITSLVTILGLFSFETYYTTPIVVVLFFFWSFRQSKLSFRQTAKILRWYLLPVAVFMPFIYIYLRTRMGYHSSTVNILLNESDMAVPLVVLKYYGNNFLLSLKSLFYQIPWTDVVSSYPGGLVNELILPTAILGCVIVFARIRSEKAYILGIWFFIQYFLFGILGAPSPRVSFPGLIGVYAIAGIGFAAIISSLNKYFKTNQTLVMTVVIVLSLGVVGYTDQQVFWKKFNFPFYEAYRRELYDAVKYALSHAKLTYLPTLPYDEETYIYEMSTIHLSAADAVGPTFFADAYKLTTFMELLPDIYSHRSDQNIGIILDKSLVLNPTVRKQSLDTILNCYDTMINYENERYLFLLISKPADYSCYSYVRTDELSPTSSSEIHSSTPIKFSWGENTLFQTEVPYANYQVVVQERDPNILWIEAESSLKLEKWHLNNFPGVSNYGTGFIIDDWLSFPLAYPVEIQVEGDYTLWVRYYQRVASVHKSFLAFDDYPLREFAAGIQNEFFDWQWEQAGSYHLMPGNHEFRISRQYGNEYHYEILVDTFMLSPDAAVDPSTGQIWQTIIDSGRLPFSVMPAYVQPQGLPAGYYRWNVTFYNTDKLVDWLGNIGSPSPFQNFQVRN